MNSCDIHSIDMHYYNSSYTCTHAHTDSEGARTGLSFSAGVGIGIAIGVAVTFVLVTIGYMIVWFTCRKQYTGAQTGERNIQYYSTDTAWPVLKYSFQPQELVILANITYDIYYDIVLSTYSHTHEPIGGWRQRGDKNNTQPGVRHTQQPTAIGGTTHLSISLCYYN